MDTTEHEEDLAVVQRRLINDVKNGFNVGVNDVLLFGLPAGMRVEVLKTYFVKHNLSDEGEFEIFKLPQQERKEVFEAYVKNCFLSDEAQMKIFELPVEEVVTELLIYFEEGGSLCSEAELLSRYKAALQELAALKGEQ